MKHINKPIFTPPFALSVFASKMYRRVALITLFTSSISLSTPSLETALQYHTKKQFDEAIACYNEIIENEPDNLVALFNLGSCYLFMSNKDKAIAAYNKILQKNPLHVDSLYNKAYTYKTFGDLDTAIEMYNQILTIDPHYEKIYNALGVAYISQGNFELGWKYHHKVLNDNPLGGSTLRSLLHNNEIANKNIILYRTGGFGDTLLYVRYAERLKNMGAHVTVTCQEELLPLLARCPYIDKLMPEGPQLPGYDAEITLMVISSAFADNEETAPKNIPYLFADPELVSYWQQKLMSDKNFKVGICWQSTINNDAPCITHRACPLEKFTRLANVDGVSFYSLQKVSGMEQLAAVSSDFPLQIFDNLDEEAGPFMDTAALIKNLDLIISVDTSIVHLAGGLGATVWMVHPYSTDWRWIHNRTDSYWYPTMRIFKQQKPFDWDGVMETVAHELQKLVEENNN